MNRPVAVLLFLAIAVLLVLIAIDAKQAHDWPAFKAAHHCQVVGIKDAYTGQKILIGPGVPINASGKVGYACDDGEVYWQ